MADQPATPAMVKAAADVLAANHPAIDDRHYWEALATKVLGAVFTGCEVTEQRRILYPDRRGPWVWPSALPETAYMVERRFVITTPAEEVNG